MNHVSNTDIIEFLTRLKTTCEADKHGGMLKFAQKAMVDHGFFAKMPSPPRDPLAPCPADWKLFQLAIFDNGPQANKGRKRSKIERTKMRYGGQIKVWNEVAPNFKADSEITWKGNVYLWDHTIAVRVSQELCHDGLVAQADVDEMTKIVGALGSEYMYSIPVLRDSVTGTRWMRGHLLCVQMTDGQPGKVIFSGGPQVGIVGTEWSEQAPNGKDLDKNVIGQMRLGSSSASDKWATEPFPA